MSTPQNRSVNLLLTDNCGRFVSVCVTKIIGQFGMITPRSCGFRKATPPCTAFSCRAIESVFTNFGFFHFALGFNYACSHISRNTEDICWVHLGCLFSFIWKYLHISSGVNSTYVTIFCWVNLRIENKRHQMWISLSFAFVFLRNSVNFFLGVWHFTV